MLENLTGYGLFNEFTDHLQDIMVLYIMMHLGLQHLLQVRIEGLRDLSSAQSVGTNNSRIRNPIGRIKKHSEMH